MAISAICPRCGFAIQAADEDDHGMEHEMPRKHVLAMLRKQESTERPPG